MCRTMFWILSYALLQCSAAFAEPAPANFFVAPNGNDAWSGKLPAPNDKHTNGPFATLERARDEIRRLKKAAALPIDGIVVELRAGMYELNKPFALTQEDSGTATAPITYRAHVGDEVRLAGGPTLTQFQPVTDAATLQRLDASARGKVVQLDLHTLKTKDLSPLKEGIGGTKADPGVELFFAEEPMTLARWPNESYVQIKDTVNIDPIDIRGTKGDRGGQFFYQGDRASRWAGENNVWLHGYWFWDWSDERLKVQSIDTTKSTITMASPHHRYGYRKGQPYYALNVLAELDRPGEWYIDRTTAVLYFWPPAVLQTARAQLSWLANIVTMDNASHIRLHGLTFEAAQQTALEIGAGTDVRISACTIRNVGGDGVSIGHGATDSGVAGCDMYNLGDGGIQLKGGDRKTLTSAKLYADNNHIHHYGRWNLTYKPAISVDGVGARVSHNLIHDAPHQALAFRGNDHVIEFNEIFAVCQQSNDAGAVYGMRDWSMRGTVIRNNYLHDISGLDGKGAVGVYLDDMLSGILVEGNIFWKVQRMAVQLGGGRDDIVRNNIFIDSGSAVATDARGLDWAKGSFDTMKKSLEAVPYQQSPWRERYPNLPNILADQPMAPKGSAIVGNIFVGGKTIVDMIASNARPFIKVEGNLEGEDPLFVDPDHGDFRLKPSSPALKRGFPPIPVERIGLYLSVDRAVGAVEIHVPGRVK